MDFNIWFTLVLASFAISFSPGPGAILSINNGINYGIKKSYWGIMGLQLGYLIQIFIVTIGLGAIILKSVLIFNIIKYIGAGYLIFLGISKILEKPKVSNTNELKTYSGKKLFIKAGLINLTNLKATVFLVAFIPQFLNSNDLLISQFIIIGLTLCIVDIIVMSIYSSLASKLKLLIRTPKVIKIQNIIMGSFLITAAALLLNANKN